MMTQIYHKPVLLQELIDSLEIKKNGFFAFKDFYIRRAKRILPVLLFVSFFDIYHLL